MNQQQNKTKVLMESNDHKLFALFYSFLLSAFFIENHHQKLRKIRGHFQPSAPIFKCLITAGGITTHLQLSCCSLIWQKSEMSRSGDKAEKSPKG